MKIREIIPLIQSNPLFSKIPQQSSTQRQQTTTTHENNELTFSPKSLLSVNNQSSEIYYYSPIECKLYVIKVESTLENTIGSIKYQELKVKINFEVYKIELNEDSRYLCIVGYVNCIIVDLNPQTVCSYFTSQEIYSNAENKTYGYDQIPVRNFILDKTFYQSQISNIIKQVEWHPLSNIHLVILYSNNVLKIYNIQNGNEDIEQTFNLESLHTYETLKKVRNNDIRNLKQNKSKFISFCFGSNINFWTRFTIFLMNDSGEVYNLCPVIPNNCLIETNFYKDFQNHILCEKNQCNGNGDQQQQQQQQKYYEFQFKWLMASVNTTPFEIENTSWLKLTSPSNIFHPLLQGPIYKTSTTIKSAPLKLLSISPIISNLDHQQQQQQNNTSVTNTKLVPFIIIILLESCESLVNICCQDTIPMWSNENGIIFDEQDQNTPKYIDLILYETLDLNEEKYPKLSNIGASSSSSRNKRQTDSALEYLSYSIPNMKYDQWSDSLYFYHNQGIQIAKFPWLVQIFLEINDHNNGGSSINGSGSNKENEIDDNIKEFETTSLISVLSSGDECIPIIGIQVFSNIKIGTYFLVLPNTFKIVVFDMDGLIDQQKQQQIKDQSTSNNNQNNDDEDNSNEVIMKSPIQKYIQNPPPFIGRITLSNSISPKEFLQVLVNTKKKLYNLYIYSNQLEIELQSRVKGLETISENQKKLIDRLKQYIENLKVNQHALNTKLKYVWDKKEIDSLEINELYRVEMEGKPISNQEKELNKTYKQINSQVNIYSERLNQIEKDLDNSDQQQQQLSSTSSSSFEEIPSDHQIEIKKVLNEHAQRIEQDVSKLEKLLKTIQISK